VKKVWKTVLVAKQYHTRTSSVNFNLELLGIPVTDTPTVTAHALYRALQKIVYEQESLVCFSSNQQATATTNNTIIIASHTEMENM
jgi:precorrin-6B methylase 1